MLEVRVLNPQDIAGYRSKAVKISSQESPDASPVGLRLVGVLPCAVFAPKAPKSSSLAAQRQSSAPYTITKSQIPFTTSSSTVLTANTSSELGTGVTGSNTISSNSTPTTCHCSSSNSAVASTAAVNNSQSKAGTLNLPPPLPPVPPRPPRVPLPIFAAANLASIRPLPSSVQSSSSSCSPLGAATTVHHHHYNTAPPPPPPVPPTAAALNPMLLVPFSVPAGLGTPTIAASHHPGSGGYTANLGKVSVVVACFARNMLDYKSRDSRSVVCVTGIS